MAKIGFFKKSGDEYHGELVTLSVQTKGVRIVPESHRTSDTDPSHRVFVGRAEIGAVWTKQLARSQCSSGVKPEMTSEYLSVKLDDPSFTAPIYATLFPDGAGDDFILVWSRPRTGPA